MWTPLGLFKVSLYQTEVVFVPLGPTHKEVSLLRGPTVYIYIIQILRDKYLSYYKLGLILSIATLMINRVMSIPTQITHLTQ
jgi:hypothetical protein